MSVSIEKSAKTVQQAINDALVELGLSADEVIIEVLDEGETGLFGLGSRPARVRVSTEDDAPVQDSYLESWHVGDDNNDAAAEETSGLDDVRDTAESVVYFGDDDESGAAETPAETEAVNYVAALLSGIGIHGKIASGMNEDTLSIDVTGQDCGAAIGRHGETLDAIQYLTSLVANRHSEDHIRVVIDIGGYRRRRERTLISLAKRTAERVQASGRAINLDPMSPSERRIIHSALQDYAGITTYSEGEEPERHVVVSVSESTPNG